MAFRPSSAAVLAQHQIFNKLCTAYMRDNDPAFLRANDVQKELAIPESAFAEALRIFQNGDQLVVEVIESDGETYFRLGGSSRYNCDHIDDS